MLEQYFKLREHGSTVRTEVLGGVTTFIAMAYIIVLNPAILSGPGLDPGPLTVATILVAVFGSLLMGLYANRPIAVAPYMGENAFIASLAAMTFGPDNLHLTWEMRLGTVFISGVVFLIITLLGVRMWLANAVSTSMKHSFAVGIGLFLAFIGLEKTGLIVKAAKAPIPVEIGNFHDTRVLLAAGGFVLIAILMCWRVRGAILIGIVVTALTGVLLGQGEAPRGIVALPFTGDYTLGPVAFQLDIRSVLQLSVLPVMLTLVLMSFLDTLGTLVAVGAAGNLLDEKGNFPDMQKPMLVDAVSCVFASVVGSSTSGAYIESATGIRDGARTGLAAVTTALLFLAALFFLPLADPLQKLSYAYGPALIAVGMMMLGSVTRIAFDEPTEAAPAFVTIVMMVFTYNIANGLTAGLILYPLMKLASGRFRELSAGSIALGLLCLVYYIFGLPH